MQRERERERERHTHTHTHTHRDRHREFKYIYNVYVIPTGVCVFVSQLIGYIVSVCVW